VVPVCQGRTWHMTPSLISTLLVVFRNGTDKDRSPVALKGELIHVTLDLRNGTLDLYSLKEEILREEEGKI